MFLSLLLRRSYCHCAMPSSTGSTLKSVVARLNDLAPLALAESWDNVGLLVEPSTPKLVRKMLLTNDLTEPVLDEAVSQSIDLIYAYHPPIFASLKRITAATWKERIVAKCLEHRIAIYSPHTCLDALKGGVNDWLVQAFGSNVASCGPLTTSHASSPAGNCTHSVEISAPATPQGKELLAQVAQLVDAVPEARSNQRMSLTDDHMVVTIYCPAKSVSSIIQLVNDCQLTDVAQTVRIIRLEKPPVPGYGMGRLVKLNGPLALGRAVDLVKEHLQLQHLRLATSNNGSKDVTTVAICAGSGASLLKNVRADLYLTGEMSHHEVLDAVHAGANVVLCEHSNTERGFLRQWRETLARTLGEAVEIQLSTEDRDPLQVI